MEDRILASTKQVLGLGTEDDAFDLDVLTYINSAFASLEQLGIPVSYIDDSEATWSDLTEHPEVMAMVRTYILLKVRIAFDPPATSFHIEAVSKQIEELEWRISAFREVGALWTTP